MFIAKHKFNADEILGRPLQSIQVTRLFSAPVVRFDIQQDHIYIFAADGSIALLARGDIGSEYVKSAMCEHYVSDAGRKTYSHSRKQLAVSRGSSPRDAAAGSLCKWTSSLVRHRKRDAAEVPRQSRFRGRSPASHGLDVHVSITSLLTCTR